MGKNNRSLNSPQELANRAATNFSRSQVDIKEKREELRLVHGLVARTRSHPTHNSTVLTQYKLASDRKLIFKNSGVITILSGVKRALKVIRQDCLGGSNEAYA